MSDVVLHVYDLSQGMASMFGYDGIWHTGIVVYGLEYAYGSGTGFGVHTALPNRSVEIPVKTTHQLGKTTKTREEFDRFVQGLERFHGTRYHLLENNCNHFTDVAAEYLLGTRIPTYISGLPQRFKSDPRYAMFQPIIEQFSGPAFAANASGMSSAGQTQTSHVTGKSPNSDAGTGSEQHRHCKLVLQHCNVSQATTFGGSCSDKIVEKYQQLCEGVHAKPQEVATLKSAAASFGDASTWPTAATVVLDQKLETTPWEMAYPLIDLLRLVIAADDQALAYFCHKKNATLKRLVNAFPKCCNNDRSSIVAVRLFTNVLRKDIGVAYMTQTNELQEQLWSVVCTALESQNLRVKQAGASCCFNFALTIGIRDTNVSLAGVVFINHILGEINMDEGDGAHDEIAFRLISALGRLLYTNDAAVETLESLGLENIVRWCGRSKKLAQITKEIELLIKP